MASPTAVIRVYLALLVLAAGVPRLGAQADLRINDADNNSTLRPSAFTQSETALVNRGQAICVGWNDIDPVSSPSRVGGWGASVDGGSSFADAGELPATLPQGGGPDPSVAYSVRDDAYYHTRIQSGALFWAIHLWRSADCCPASLCPGSGFQYSEKIHWKDATGSGSDREMIAVDNNYNAGSNPYFGRAYVSFARVTAAGLPSVPQRIVVAWSDDVEGQSDSDGLPPSQFVTLPVPDPYDVIPQGAYVAVAPTGEVYVAIVELTPSIGSDLSYRLYKSTNGGVSWQRMMNPIGVGRRPEHVSATLSCDYGAGALRGNIRILPAPQLAIQPTASSSPPYVIHAVYFYDSDGDGLDESDVFYRRSIDGGENWLTQFRLNWDDPSATDQWQPSIAVTDSGVVAATWYDRRIGWPHYNPRFVRAATLSMDGGSTWERNAQLSDVVSDVTFTGSASPPVLPSDPAFGVCYHSDYDQMVASGNAFHVVWSDDRELRDNACGSFPNCPNPDVYYEQIVDAHSDGVYEPWDICNAYANPRVTSPAWWMTLMSRQRDGDADGFGNVCDPDYTNGVKNGSVAGNLYVNFGDYAWMNREMFASQGQPIASQTCGRQQNLPCDFFDKNEDGVVDSADYAIWAQGNPARPIHNAWYVAPPGEVSNWPNPLNTRSGPSSCVDQLTGDFSCEWQTECCGPWCGPAC